MADVPAGIPYGEIQGLFIRFLADSADAGDTPDAAPLTGSVRIEPLVPVMRWPGLTPPRTAAYDTMVCPLNSSGELCAPDTTTPGVRVIASVQPDGNPSLIQYRATFSLANVRTQPTPVVFSVPAGGVVNLTTVMPETSEPGTVQVLVSADSKAEAAALTAEALERESGDAALADALARATGSSGVSVQGSWTYKGATSTPVKRTFGIVGSTLYLSAFKSDGVDVGTILEQLDAGDALLWVSAEDSSVKGRLDATGPATRTGNVVSVPTTVGSGTLTTNTLVSVVLALGGVGVVGAGGGTPLVDNGDGTASSGAVDVWTTDKAIPAKDATTGAWHFDVVQGQNDGTVLPFTSRAVSASTGLPVAQQIIAKPSSDTSEGIIDWRHDAAGGDLIHFTAGPNMGGSTGSGGAALIAMGLDNGYPIGLFINNKGTATRGIGIKIEQNATINVATAAYGIELNQHSPTSPGFFALQDNNTAPVMILQAVSGVTVTNQSLLKIVAAGEEKGIIRSQTGQIYWKADVITHDGGGFLNVSNGTTSDTNQTKQLSDGFYLGAYAGATGVFYMGRLSRASAGLKMDVALNTSGGVNYAPTWQTGLTVFPGSSTFPRAGVLLGTGDPANNEINGYPYMPAGAGGSPTAAPTAKTGYVPFLYDTTANKIWVYNGGWKQTAALT